MMLKKNVSANINIFSSSDISNDSTFMNLVLIYTNVLGELFSFLKRDIIKCIFRLSGILHYLVANSKFYNKNLAKFYKYIFRESTETLALGSYLELNF